MRFLQVTNLKEIHLSLFLIDYKRNTILKSLNKQDLATTEILTERGILICAFSQKRYQKDKQDTEKQINRAKKTISDPKKNIKRLKFVTTANTKLTINKK